MTARNRRSSGLSPNRGWANSNMICESGLIRQPVRFRVDTLDHARHRHSPTRCRPRELPTAESAHESGDKVLSRQIAGSPAVIADGLARLGQFEFPIAARREELFHDLAPVFFQGRTDVLIRLKAS